MQRIRLAALAVVLGTAAACGGGNAAPINDGPVLMGVVAGNHQVVPAAPDAALPQRVATQVYRGPNGTVALRVLDAMLPPKALAQTAVTGVPNQVVCASAPDPKHALRAEVSCANSDAQGMAYFVFHHDSVAGTSTGQIAAALSTGTKITDSVSATVLPGVVDSNAFVTGYVQQKGDTVRADLVRDKFANALPFAIVSDSLITVAGTVAGTLDARRFTFVTPTVPKPDRITTVLGADGKLIAHMRYTLQSDGKFYVSMSGLNRTP